MREEQNEKRESIKPDRAIERFEMVVGIFKPQLSISWINGRTERTQTFAKLARGVAEIKSIGLHVTGGHCLELDLDRGELRFAVVTRKLRRADPSLGFAFQCRHNQKRAAIHRVGQKCEPIAHSERFLLLTIEWFLGALQAMPFVRQALQFRQRDKLLK